MNKEPVIKISRRELITKICNPHAEGDWVLAIDPETLESKVVYRQPDGFVPDVSGHEDLFPLSMAFEREDGFIEGGDWLVATTPKIREHDGWYRSYWIEWLH